MKRFICAFLLLVLVVTVLPSCGNDGESSKKELETVMTVGGFEVSYEIYRYALLNSKDSYISANGEIPSGEVGEKAIAEIRENALGALRNMYVILATCADYDIHIDDQLIKDKIASKIALKSEEYESDKAFYADLATSHMNKSVYGFLCGLQACQDELYYAMIKSGDISTDDEYIKSLIESDAFVRVKQVLIKFDVDDDGKDDGDRASKLETAEKVRSLALEGEDFDRLVQAYGNDIFMFNNKDGYYLIRGVNYTEFEDAAFALEIGEISEVVETPVGYSVILRCEKEESYMTKNYESLASDYAASVFSLRIESEFDSLDIVTNDVFAKYGFDDIK